MTTLEPGDPRELEVADPDLEPDADFPADTAPAETLLARALHRGRMRLRGTAAERVGNHP